MILRKSDKSKKRLWKSKDVPNTEKKNDQRRHFRLVCSISATIKTINKTSSGTVIPDDPRDVVICNISGGGVRFLTDFLLSENDRILITFKLNDDILILTGEVRVLLNDPETPQQYQYGVMFTGLTDKDQDIIYKYLFQEQIYRVLAD